MTPGPILDALPANIALVDPAGVILAVNESWRKFGVANALQGSDFFVGRNYLEICDRVQGECTAEAHAAAAGIRRVLAGELPAFALEYPCHAPAEQRWFRLMVSPLQPAHPAGAVVMHVNMTERKLAELALAQSEQAQRQLAAQLEAERARLVAAQAVAKIGSWETDSVTFAVVWSEQTHRIFETDPATFTPTHRAFLNFIHPEDRETVDAAFTASLADTDTHTIGHRIVLPGGREKFIEEHWRFFPATAGRAARAIGTCRDVTEQRKIERELRDSEESMQFVLSTSRIGFWDHDLRTNQTRRSLQHDRCFGYHELQPKWDHEIFLAHVHPDDRERFQRVFQAASIRLTDYSIEFRTIWPDHSLHWVLSMGRFAPDHTGAAFRASGVVLEVTQRKLTEEKILAQLHELERWHQVTLGREDRLQALKAEVNELLQAAGQPPRYAPPATALITQPPRAG